MKSGDIVTISETGRIYSGISGDGPKYGVVVKKQEIYVGFNETRKMWKIFIDGRVEMFYAEDLKKVF